MEKTEKTGFFFSFLQATDDCVQLSTIFFSGDNGGSEADFETAMFIFSSDNTCPDTER